MGRDGDYLNCLFELFLEYFNSSPISRVLNPHFFELKSHLSHVITVIQHCNDPQYNNTHRCKWQTTLTTKMALSNYFQSIWIPVPSVELEFSLFRTQIDCVCLYPFHLTFQWCTIWQKSSRWIINNNAYENSQFGLL